MQNWSSFPAFETPFTHKCKLMQRVPGFRRLQPFAGFGAERPALRHNHLLLKCTENAPVPKSPQI